MGTKRVILGRRGSDTGLWVSKPGADAATASSLSDYLINTSKTSLRPVMAGVISSPSLPYRGGNPASDSNYTGYVFYYKDYVHNLGYIPVAHFSIGSAYAGEVYPTIYIDATKVRLYHQMENRAAGTGVVEWRYEYHWTGSQWRYEWVRYSEKKLVSPYPSSMDYACTIHYTFYKQSTGL